MNIELLSPVGDIDCLKVAIENGANSVYLGASSFNARMSSTNFDLANLKKAIEYAKVRDVKTYLTLNTLVTNTEFLDAVNLAKEAFEYGIDGIITQDLGLGKFLINNFPSLPVHASTQMTTHNLEGVKKLEELGFSRVVLSRELSIDEIEHICKNTNIEIEVFVHGALCFSYSGQCLISSMIGGRSGNRGKCAGSCRLPYKLLADDKEVSSGFLLSPKDISALDYLPSLINTGVKCFKIEGRLKPPEYVATVTRTYRKYIDMVLENKKYIINKEDITNLLQVFNRGGAFSSGHIEIFKDKPGNLGIYLGKILAFNPNKGLITISPETSIEIGDTISLEKEENSKYTISEITNKGNSIIIGRMKGNINVGDKVFKMSSKKLNAFSPTFIKKQVQCNVYIKKSEPIKLEIIYKDINFTCVSDIIPEDAINSPITKDRIISQISKTGNTPFEFSNINIELDDNLFILSIGSLNELRRQALEKLEQTIIDNGKRKLDLSFAEIPTVKNNENKKISLLLNNLDIDYTKLDNIDNLYIPLKYFLNTSYLDGLKYLSEKFNIYIYMPNIIRKDFKIVNMVNIKGAVISSLSNLELLKKFPNLELIGNYTLNIYNNFTAKSLQELGINRITISPELNKENINSIGIENLKTELIAYGNLPLMTSDYCVVSNSNKCTSCNSRCKGHRFYLKDRMNFSFRLIPDNVFNTTTIYNSKITSIDTTDINVDYLRIDILDENIEEVNNIIKMVRSRKKIRRPRLYKWKFK